jgi:hypothetical protein
VFRELLYRWHPWFGLRVCVHEAIDKADGVVFRCTLSGSDADRWLEVPAWMFDRATCADQATTNPFVDMAALSALASLLTDVLKARSTSSNTPLSSASRVSRDQNRGEAHVREDSSVPDAGAAAPDHARAAACCRMETSRPFSIGLAYGTRRVAGEPERDEAAVGGMCQHRRSFLQW